jgi:hypothetical protein
MRRLWQKGTTTSRRLVFADRNAAPNRIGKSRDIAFISPVDLPRPSLCSQMRCCVHNIIRARSDINPSLSKRVSLVSRPVVAQYSTAQPEVFWYSSASQTSPLCYGTGVHRQRPLPRTVFFGHIEILKRQMRSHAAHDLNR